MDQPQKIDFDGEAVLLAIPENLLSDLAEKYVAAMEVQRTNEWCKCQWITHPEDVDIRTDICGECGHSLELFTVDFTPEQVGLPYCHAFGNDTEWAKEGKAVCGHTDCKPRKPRLRRGMFHPECPVHTKEGFLIGFFKWVFKDLT